MRDTKFPCVAEARGAVGKALRVALRSDIPLPRVEPRESGISFLMNPRRRQVYVHVAHEPGTHLRRAARSLGIPTQSLRWHVQVLLAAQLIRETRIRGRAAYFCEGLVEAGDEVFFVCLQDPMNQKIWRALLRTGSLVQAELVRRVGSYEQHVTPHLRWMVDAGLLTAAREVGHRVYRLASATERLEKRYAASQEGRAERVLAVLRAQGLAPRIVSRAGSSLSVAVSSGQESTTLRFDLVPLPR